MHARLIAVILIFLNKKGNNFTVEGTEEDEILSRFAPA